ncbi:hypothetical protein AJ80_05010 [Polytolypa hystricis UAMH7299]|uniref:alpha-1,2-Mannosidase n=1 Tax=Polytolypa hystricis (strain UAMH7299) TaxID=1447883 RepID=A0A2B7Y7U0_POLH7|nr:hypothetical protein AJ80_05010 [Polytolypa hystricis UAMH7299]
MRESQIRDLRQEAEQIFYHGFENYMEHAFPEDELRPITCGPLTRDRDNPGHIELNDVLGNYSLTLIDSLSTLAILSSANSTSSSGYSAWSYFQDGVRNLVELYGDGSEGPKGRGSRGKGFESDSKVQVFETVIRGLGGLLSAHLFAVGDLPIRGYDPPEKETAFAKRWNKGENLEGHPGIRWSNGFVYDGQLLRLAMDLANRILPAFYTATGLPYPRVNLRHGVPFYPNSPFNANIKPLETDREQQPVRREVTETCSAGAGSLVLEFTVLSRLTGDGRFEELAKRAFWAVWTRRSDIGLIGAGIDAESGNWVSPYTGIGAGIDSFFEYALKSHILLSEGDRPEFNLSSPFKDLDNYYDPLTDDEHSSEAFLQVWHEAQASIKHHLYRGSSYQHPHYIQGDIVTGATRAFWIDSLSAFFPGVLTLAGDVDGAVETHLLNAALWTRFSALPERWNVATGDIEGGLGWWGGRPEFVESNYYLYRATKDPWYLHVGEMVLRDIKRRCWTKCGWAGLQDVRNGKLNDRMESFFLGETAKYLFLSFDSDHPLNHLDAPFVFNTEGHPLVIPKKAPRPKIKSAGSELQLAATQTCRAPTSPLPFGMSSTVARPDIFHAASLARLHRMPKRSDVESPIVEYSDTHPSITISDLFSPSNYTYFPWTLPLELVPHNATSAPMARRPTLDLSFPPMPNLYLSSGSLERVQGGILIKSVGGLRLGMIQDIPLLFDALSKSTEGFRIQVINNVPLGKDEKVYIAQETANVLNPKDPNFLQIQDSTMLDIVIDVDFGHTEQNGTSGQTTSTQSRETVVSDPPLSDPEASFDHSMRMVFASIMNHMTSLLHNDAILPSPSPSNGHRSTTRISIPAITSTGKGSAPLPETDEASLINSVSSATSKQSINRLSWTTVYLTDELCDHRLPPAVPRTHQVIVVKRGGCSFSQKLRNIPSFRPSRSSLQLVIVVSYPQESNPPPSESDAHSDPNIGQPLTIPELEFEEASLIRPLLDDIQVVAGGIPRPNPLSMVMVGGGDKAYEYLKRASGVGIRRRYSVRSQGVPISNLFVI